MGFSVEIDYQGAVQDEKIWKTGKKSEGFRYFSKFLGVVTR
jgi:hypothetical protein